MNIYEFTPKRQKTDLSWINVIKSIIEADCESKLSVLDEAYELVSDFLSEMHLDHIDFKVKEEQVMDFQESFHEESIEELVDEKGNFPIFDLQGRDEEVLYDVVIFMISRDGHLCVDCNVLRIENQTVHMAGRNCQWHEIEMQEAYINNETKAFMPAAALSGLTEKQKKIMAEDSMGRRVLLTSMLHAFSSISDSVFESVYKKNKGLLDIFEKVPNVVSVDWYVEPGMKEPAFCLIPNPDCAYGLAVRTNDKGGFDLCALVIDEEFDLEDFDSIEKGMLLTNIPLIKLMPVASTKSVDEMAGTLEWMLDHFGRDDEDWIVPLSLHSYRIYDDNTDNWINYANAPDFANETFLKTLVPRQLSEEEIEAGRVFDALMDTQDEFDEEDYDNV